MPTQVVRCNDTIPHMTTISVSSKFDQQEATKPLAQQIIQITRVEEVTYDLRSSVAARPNERVEAGSPTDGGARRKLPTS